MESAPQSSKEAMEFNGEHFEIDKVATLEVSNIQRGDRVLVVTESGNRYMLRRSESRNGALMISNERESHFNTFYPLYQPREVFAEVGKVMEFMAVTNEQKSLGSTFTSSKIIDIEIRRGLDKATNNTPQTISVKGIADMLRDQVRGRREIL